MSWFQALLMSGTGLNPGGGHDYYVSEAGTGSGLSQATPMSLADFISLTKNQFDRFFFNRGDEFVFPELEVTIDNLTFSTYGSGADPVFLGSDPLSGATWTSETGGYYSTPLASAPKWVFNPAGEAARQGQSDWIPVTAMGAGGSERTFSTAVLNPFNTVQSLIGAKARFKEFDFRMSFEFQIVAYNTGTGVTGFSATVPGSTVGYPMKLYGQKQFATLEGDWWYDTANARLWIKTASDPTGLDWRVCTEDYAFNLDECTNTTITGIEFTQYYRTAIEALTAHNTTVTANIHDIRGNGLWWYGNATNMSFTGSILRAGLNGAMIGGLIDPSFTLTEMAYIGQQANEPWPIDTYFRKHSGQGIACSDDTNETQFLPSGVTVTGVFHDIANIPVAPYGNNWIVDHCHIYTWATRFADSGGYHSFYSDALGVGLSTAGNVVSNCIIHGGVGSTEGIVNYPKISFVSAVYLDAGTSDTEIANCTLFDTPYCGVFCNYNTEQTYIHDCLIANASTAGNGAQVFYYEQPDATNSPNFSRNQKNVLEDNILVSGRGQYSLLCASDGSARDTSYNPFVTGNSDRNTYVQLHATVTTSANPTSLNTIGRHESSVTPFAVSVIGATFTNLSLSGWQTRYSDDAASTSQGFYFDTSGPNAAAANSPIEVVVLFNPTASIDNQNMPQAGIYNNLAGSQIDDADVPAWGGFIGVLKPSYYYLMDSFLGASGSSIIGRNPKIGNTWNVIAGTHAINNGSDMASSVAGQYSVNTGQSDLQVEDLVYCTNVSSIMRNDYRLADNTSSSTNRILVDFTGTDLQVRENSGSGLVQIALVPFVHVINTVYRRRVVLNGSNLKVYINGVLLVDVTTTVLTGTWVAQFGETTRFSQFIIGHPIYP